MNKGVIYKILNDGNVKYCIRLDKTVKIEDEELNIYFYKAKIEDIIKEKSKENKGNDIVIKDAVTLFLIEKPFTSDIDLTAYLGKKLEFTLSFKDDEGNKDKKDKIISIEETTINND